MTGCVDREEHRPGDAAADKTHGGGNFQISKEQKAIEGLVVQDIAVGNFVKRPNPIEKSTGQFRRAFSVRGDQYSDTWLSMLTYWGRREPR